MTPEPAFERWFGDSKVVDANGKPLVMHHVTDADFNAFDVSQSWRELMFFAKSDEGARKATTKGDRISYPVFIRAEKVKGHPSRGIFYGELDSAKYRSKLLQDGYDGVWVRDEAGTSLAVFDGKQVKSAVGNDGRFDPTNPDIRFSLVDQDEDPDGEIHTDAPCP
jgi:hypothetical protein